MRAWLFLHPAFVYYRSEIAAEIASSGILPYIYDPESEEETEAPEEPRVTIYELLKRRDTSARGGGGWCAPRTYGRRGGARLGTYGRREGGGEWGRARRSGFS